MKRSRLLLGALVGAQVALAGCGGGDEPGGLVTETVGTGPQTATIVRPAGDERRPVVLFLHGWGATRPRFYRPWIDHLAREGNAVICPRYQDSVVDPPAEVLGNVLAGVCRRSRGSRRSRARSWSPGTRPAGPWPPTTPRSPARPGYALNTATGTGSFAGRTLPGVRVGIPEFDPGQIPAGPDVVALAGTDDTVVGSRVARRIARHAGATDKRLVVVEDPAASDHLAPQRADAAARREFWDRLDALIRRARR